MSKERLLWILIIVLIVVNGLTLFFMISGSRSRPVNNFDRTVIRVLQLSDAQIKQFDVMKKEHHQEIIRIDREMRSTYQRYFHLLSDRGNNIQKDSLEMVLSNKQKEKSQITYQHFDNLKNICNSDQKEKFIELIPLLMQVIDPPKKSMPPRRN